MNCMSFVTAAFHSQFLRQAITFLGQNSAAFSSSLSWHNTRKGKMVLGNACWREEHHHFFEQSKTFVSLVFSSSWNFQLHVAQQSCPVLNACGPKGIEKVIFWVLLGNGVALFCRMNVRGFPVLKAIYSPLSILPAKDNCVAFLKGKEAFCFHLLKDGSAIISWRQ